MFIMLFHTDGYDFNVDNPDSSYWYVYVYRSVEQLSCLHALGLASMNSHGCLMKMNTATAGCV